MDIILSEIINDNIFEIFSVRNKKSKSIKFTRKRPGEKIESFNLTE